MKYSVFNSHVVVPATNNNRSVARHHNTRRQGLERKNQQQRMMTLKNVTPTIFPMAADKIHSFYLNFLQLYCPSGISHTGNSGCLPQEKTAATESRYPTYSACWVF